MLNFATSFKVAVFESGSTFSVSFVDPSRPTTTWVDKTSTESPAAAIMLPVYVPGAVVPGIVIVSATTDLLLCGIVTLVFSKNRNSDKSPRALNSTDIL